MPLNEIEQHPYLIYFISHHGGVEKVLWQKYTRMFIGSFPVYEITKTVYPEQSIEDRSLLPKEKLWNFFYGSKKNQFWEYLIGCFKNKNDTPFVIADLSEEELIQFLEKNNILLTDVIECTNRFNKEKKIPSPYSPADTALMNKEAIVDVMQRFQFNDSIVDWLTKCKNIDSIYFTAQDERGKCPAGWFYGMLEETGVVIKELHRFDGSAIFHFGYPIDREITLFFLPSPASSRSVNMNAKRTPHRMFYNYVKRIDAKFLKTIEELKFKIEGANKEILKEHRSKFIMEWWFEFVREKNKDYDGTIDLL